MYALRMLWNILQNSWQQKGQSQFESTNIQIIRLNIPKSKQCYWCNQTFACLVALNFLRMVNAAQILGEHFQGIRNVQRVTIKIRHSRNQSRSLQSHGLSQLIFLSYLVIPLPLPQSLHRRYLYPFPYISQSREKTQLVRIIRVRSSKSAKFTGADHLKSFVCIKYWFPSCCGLSMLITCQTGIIFNYWYSFRQQTFKPSLEKKSAGFIFTSLSGNVW